MKTDSEIVYGRDLAEHIGAAFGIDRGTAQQLAEIEKRGGTFQQSTAAEIEANGVETERLFKEEFRGDADAVLARAREMLKQRPELMKALESSGAGNHHSLVLPIARTAAKQLEAEKKKGEFS